MKCKVCNKEGDNSIYIVKEMMFGWDEEFTYFQCSNCECLQISEYPQDISKYYPPEYVSLSKDITISQSKIKTFFKSKIAQFITGEKRNIIGMILYLLFGAGFVQKLKNTKLSLNARILDIGTGTGYNLLNLAKYGFTNLTGTDIYIEHDINYKNGVKIIKTDFIELEEKYDFIMLNHVFEHMPNPKEILSKLFQLLNPHGQLLIRIPVVNCFTWRKYQTNWVALDAPRHFFLHSHKSLSILAKESGFKLIGINYDSSDYQFWASEQYSVGIPLRHKDSYYENKTNSIFSNKQITYFKKKAKELNKINDGNAAAFYFIKP